MRTALGILGYSLAFLGLFDRKFYRSMPNLPSFSPLLFLTSSYQSAYYMPPSHSSYLSAHSSVPARLCRPERHWRYNQYPSDTYGWAGSQTIVWAAIRDCRTHRSFRCLHCCRDGDSPPYSSSSDMNIVTIGSLKTKCTPYTIIYICIPTSSLFPCFNT